VFDVVYRVCRYHRVSFRYRCSLALIVKRGILIQLVPFDLLQVFLPLGVTILEVKAYGFVVVLWDLVSVFEYGAVAVALQPGLVHHSAKLLDIAYVTFARLPTGGLHEAVLEGIQGHRDRIVLKGDPKVVP
jgi:hypothetical protein